MRAAQKIVLAVAVLFAIKGTAQITLSVYGTGSCNTPFFFNSFRNAYNEANAATLKSKLGLPLVGYGYTIALGYRVTHLSTSVTKSYFQAHTSAKFTNGSKRRIDFYQGIITVNIGYFGYKADESEFTLDGGLVHAVSTMYSYVQYPDKTKDAFAGISTTMDYISLGGDLRFCYLRRLTDAIWLDCMLQGIYLHHNLDFAPSMTYGADGRATLDFIGLTASVGLTLKIGKHFE